MDLQNTVLIWLNEQFSPSGVFQAYDQMDVLSQQVLQERELRSVTEGWLMEDRATWQEVSRLAADTRTTGCNMTTLLDTVRYACVFFRPEISLLDF